MPTTEAQKKLTALRSEGARVLNAFVDGKASEEDVLVILRRCRDATVTLAAKEGKR